LETSALMVVTGHFLISDLRLPEASWRF